MCVSHKECKFRAQFGPRRGDKKILLKSCNPFHNGIDRFGRYDNGKNFKQQITTTISPNIGLVESVKNPRPVAKDVVKAKGYKRNHRYYSIVQPSTSGIIQKWKNNKIRTTAKLRSVNSVSWRIQKVQYWYSRTVVDYEKCDDGSISKNFVCPRITFRTTCNGVRCFTS